MTDKKPMTNFHTLTDQELEQISGGGSWWEQLLDYWGRGDRKISFSPTNHRVDL